MITRVDPPVDVLKTAMLRLSVSLRPSFGASVHFGVRFHFNQGPRKSQRRDPDDFQQILRGGAGQGGIYDWWRMFSAKLRGEQFNREHGRK